MHNYKAAEIKVVSIGEFQIYKYQLRNQWMVDQSDALLCYFDGETGSGTYNCIKYAASKNKDLYRITPQYVQDSGKKG